MLGTMRTVAAAGMALVTAGAANAGGPDFKLRISLGGPVICPPAPCEPVVRYRKETVWETVPRTEVWYDACGHRHTRTVYEKVCRTVWVPIEDCHTGTTVVFHDHDHGHHGWHDRSGRGYNDRGWDRDRDRDGRGWDDRGDRRAEGRDDDRDRRSGSDFGDRIAPSRYAAGGAAAQHSAPARAQQSEPARQVAAKNNDAARRVEAEQKVRALQNANKGRLVPAAAAEKAPKREGLLALSDEIMARRSGK